ncbi:hypothetical protein J7E45_06430 [Microbacterium sp. ISL-59]|uniref:hypothetical protein n=1 Tax=Microbacterium sp. ISL-59 TaxID=2819159 RepID=UPI001BE9A4A9|nr:hypothetical protein [Microbacterium sp. ISL-59]MBT2495242.1 hypothetical protein [Microbacterium sp. ISL-59]
MNSRASAPTGFLVLFLVLGLTGCQFGEYTMYADCEALSEEVADVVSSTLEAEPEIDEFWAGESEYWCSFVVVTDLDLDSTDVTRQDVGDQIEGILEGRGRGIDIRVTYNDQSDSFSTGLGAGY